MPAPNSTPSFEASVLASLGGPSRVDPAVLAGVFVMMRMPRRAAALSELAEMDAAAGLLDVDPEIERRAIFEARAGFVA